MSETAMMNGAEWLARALAGTGMTHVFFVELVMRRTLLQLGDLGVKPILAHSEKAAAYMADGYARVAGRPGVCMAQSVGAANLASGLQDRLARPQPGDRVDRPQGAVVPAPQRLSGDPARAAVRGGHEILHAGRFDRRAAAPAAPRLARRAGRYAAPDPSRFLRPAGRRDRTRPDRRAAGYRHRGAGDSGAPAGRRRARHRARRGDPDRRPPPRDRRRRRGRRLQGRPGGAGAGRGAGGAGRDDAGARGIIPTTHRLSVGVAGSYSAPPANRIVHGADLVLFVGCDTGDQVTLNWTVPPLDTKIVQIEADPLEIGRSYPNTTGLVGDPKATLARLVQVVGRPARDRLCRGSGADRRRLARRHGAADREEYGADRRRAAVRRGHPRIAGDGILVADTGYSGIWTGTMIELNGAGQTYLRAAGSLGWSFPASLGAQCAAGAAQGGVLHRRRRVLLPPRRIGDGAPLRHPGQRSSSTTIPALART